MSEGDGGEQLSGDRQFVLVLRLTVEPDGRVWGELVDSKSMRRRRVAGLGTIADAVRTWLDNAVEDTAE